MIRLGSLMAILLISSVRSFSSRVTRNVATQVLQGTGMPRVDLNQYNIPYTNVADEWKLEFVRKVNEKETNVRLQAKSPQNYADLVTVTFERGESLGLELLELAGGRMDGLGITIVQGTVEGAPASLAEDAIQPGDAMVELALVRSKQDQQSAEQSVVTIPLEGLDYDRTVLALESLPKRVKTPESLSSEVIQLTVKRLRRRPKIKVHLQYPPSQNETDTTIELFAGENLRQGMLIRGVKLNDPLAKRFDTKNGGNCGAGGLCRTCAVSVLRGKELLNDQRPAEKQMLQDDPRWRLACKAIVGFGMQEGELTIKVNPRQWNNS